MMRLFLLTLRASGSLAVLLGIPIERRYKAAKAARAAAVMVSGWREQR